MKRNSELHDISLIWHGETDKAICVSEGGNKEWLPKSQVTYEKKADGSVEVTLPDWLYIEKGFIS